MYKNKDESRKTINVNYSGLGSRLNFYSPSRIVNDFLDLKSASKSFRKCSVQFCYVVYNSRLFNGFNNCTFWSIIVVITLGKCAHRTPAGRRSGAPHMASLKVNILYGNTIYTVELQWHWTCVSWLPRSRIAQSDSGLHKFPTLLWKYFLRVWGSLIMEINDSINSIRSINDSGQCCQVSRSLHCHSNPKSRPFWHLSRPLPYYRFFHAISCQNKKCTLQGLSLCNSTSRERRTANFKQKSL
jgi:hypothetical protein